MDSATGKSDVLGKMDALLTRHKTGESAQQNLMSAEALAARAAIPVLTEIVTEDNAIPVLTEAIPAVKASVATPVASVQTPPQVEPAVREQAGTDDPMAHTLHDEATLRQIEEFMVQELENRIALEFAATLDRTLNELLDQTREHIRLAVRVALKQRLNNAPSDPPPPP